MNPISYLYELIGCCHPIDHWEYGWDGHLVSSSSENERILDILFCKSGIKDYMTAYGAEHTMPLILGSSLGNLWIAFFSPDAASFPTIRYHVLGPLFVDYISGENLERRADQYDTLPLNWKPHFLRLVSRFPVVPWPVLTQYIIMLHYAITGERITAGDFAYQPCITVSDRPMYVRHTEDTFNKTHTWRTEQQLLACIREGNLHFHDILSKASTVSSGVGIDLGDSLRRSKDSSIVFTALCSRAAIDGGLSPQSAYAVQNQYTLALETAGSISEIAAVNHQMYEDYITRVHKLQALPYLSPQIRSCCDYIELHIQEDISIETLAKNVGYTDYYLSRKFKSETGSGIQAYIRSQRMLLAKNLLVSTDLSVQEISEQLHFCSRSYFADTFHKCIGISPTEYREKYRIF